MTIESVVYISDFNTAYPGAGDLKSEGDDHIRNIKTGVKATFPNISGVVGIYATGTSNLVGIGAAAGANTALHVHGVAANPALRIQLAGSPNQGWLRLGDQNEIKGGSDYGGTLFVYGGTTYLTLDNGGRLYGSALHNNATAPTGTVNQFIASGTYTPTLTSVTNISASTARAAQWMRVGNVVTVSGQFDLTTSSGSSFKFELGISLPIASTLGSTWNLGGTASTVGSGVDGVGPVATGVMADTANNRATVKSDIQPGAVARTWAFQFTYVVL